MGILLDFSVGFRMTGCEAIQLSHCSDDATGWTTRIWELDLRREMENFLSFTMLRPVVGQLSTLSSAY